MMNKNVKIARELIRLAHKIISATLCSPYG